MKGFIKVYCFSTLCFLSMGMIQDSLNKNREVSIQSGGFNGGYGYVVIKVTNGIVLIDTSFYPSDWQIPKKRRPYVDTLRVERNRAFYPDIKKSIGDKWIYNSLATLSLDSLKLYSYKSQNNKGIGIHENLIITESGRSDTLKFILPPEKISPTNKYLQFLANMQDLFPFSSSSKYFYCKEFYK